MRVCIGCTRWGQGPICDSCRGDLHRAGRVTLGSGLQVFAAYTHSGTARRLVHRLKYAGMYRAAEVLSLAMLEAMPADVAALVPVPRAIARKLRYGVDPAVLLARLIGREAAIPVVYALRAPVWWPSNAGTSRGSRSSPEFSPAEVAPTGSLLVDDVVTTGMTLLAAAALTGLPRALTATRAVAEVAR